MKKTPSPLKSEQSTTSLRVLFIGNSATYVNNVPQTLGHLSTLAGHCLEASAITQGGAMLSQHADASTAHGRAVLNEIAKGYDLVFLQDNGNCISSSNKRAATLAASQILDQAIRASGAKTCFYVRPPYGKDASGYNSIAQCVEFDKLFGEIASTLGTENVYVNRAFAYAIQNLDVPLWGADNAHTSVEGAYLIVCVFFASLFHTSATVLDANGLPDTVALALQHAADQVVLNGWTMDSPSI